MFSDIVTIEVLVAIGIAFIAAGISIEVMADQKRDGIEAQLNSLYSDVQSRLLEPMLTQLIFQKKAQQNPTAYMASPEVVEDLREFKSALMRYMSADGYREVIFFSLSSAGISLIVTGLLVVFLMVIDIIITIPDANYISFLFSLVGIVMFLYFQRKYAAYTGKYFEVVRELRRIL